MRKYHARLLCAGLGAFFLPACMGMPVRLVPEQPTDASVPATVRRVAPDPVAPQVQQQQQVMVQAIAGQPVQGPNGEWLMPVQIVTNTPNPPTTMPGQTLPAPVPDEEPTGIITVMHTAEPPLATLPPAKPTTPPPAPHAVVKKAIEPPVTPLQTPAAPPRLLSSLPEATYPPGYQVLILQPSNDSGAMKPASHLTSSVPNLLTPPSPPEELKLVSTPLPKTAETCSALVGAIKAYQDKSPQEASRQLASLDPATQDLLKKLLPLAVRLSDGTQQADPAEVAEVVEQLQQVLTTLRAKAALRIEKLCYCRPPAKPARLGAVQPLPDDHAYRAGESVELYMELRNFSCEAKDREYATHLSTVLEIRNEAGEVVCHHQFERDRPEAGTAPRNEYFHICRFPVQGLNAGQYTLTARVTDVPTGKTAEKTLPLMIEPARRTTARGTAE